MNAKVAGEDGPEITPSRKYKYTRSPMADWSEESGNRFIPYPDSPKAPEGKHYNYLHNTD